MSEQKNAFFGNDGFFFADWLPVEIGEHALALVNTKYAQKEVSDEVLNLLKKANPNVEI